MSSTAPNSSLVHDLYARMLGVLEVDETTRYQVDAENARELRFALRKVVMSLVTLAQAGGSDRESYQEGVVDAGGQDAVENSKSIAYKATVAIFDILDEAEWGFQEGKELAAQAINVTLKGLLQGLRVTIESLSDMLKEDGTADIEYSDDEAPIVNRGSAKKSKTTDTTESGAPATPGRRGNFTVTKGLPWADREVLEMMYVERDHPHMIQADRTAEHNRRMIALRTRLGHQQERERTRNAYRLQLGKLRESTITIAGLESRLRVTGEGGDEAED